MTVKIPRKGKLHAAEAEQFLREACAAAQLNHPNIVSVHEVGRIDVVSDLIDGVTLAYRLTAGTPTALDGEPIVSRPTAKAERAWRWAKHNPATAGLSAALLLALVFGTAVSNYREWRSDRRAYSYKHAMEYASREQQSVSRNLEEAKSQVARLSVERGLRGGGLPWLELALRQEPDETPFAPCTGCGWVCGSRSCRRCVASGRTPPTPASVPTAPCSPWRSAVTPSGSTCRR